MDASCERRNKRGPYLMTPGPWLVDLRRLKQAGFSDRETARELGRLYPALTFTRRRVWLWRMRDQRRKQDRPPDDESLTRSEARLERRLERVRRRHDHRAYQVRNGWGHLRADLTPAEVRILCAFRDHGALSQQELSLALGLQSPRTRRRGLSRVLILARKLSAQTPLNINIAGHGR